MEIFDTLTLMEVLRVQRPPTTYWLDSFFPRTVTFQTEEILFDTVIDTRRLAPFVAPNVQGRVMREQGYSTKTFRPAYAKPKHVVTPQRAIPRRAGETITGSLSLQERFDAIVADNMRMENESLERLFDWMAAQAIVNGSVTVAGEDYPSVTVDFGRDASLSVIMSGAARWDQAGTSHPLADITAARQNAFNLGRSPINRLTFGLDAWAAFSTHAEITPLLSTLNRGSETVFNTAVPDAAPYQFMGRLAGQGGAGLLDLYTYNDMYEDDTNTSVPYMDQKTVVGTGSNINGIRCFGAIQDKRAGLIATDKFPKMWDVEDPSATYTMTQSAPLMVPATPNGTFRLKVIT
jgi:hypothetical protein